MKFKLKGIFVKTLLIILAISFVMFGIINFFSGVGEGNIAKINDEKIGTNKFIKYLNEKRNQYYQSEMNDTDMNFFNSKDFVNFSLSEFINEILIQNEIRKLNIEEPKEVILANIYNDENFKDDKGNFDLNKFKIILQRSNFNEESYIKYMAFYESRNNLMQLITSENLFNDSILKPLFKKNNEFMIVDIIKINANDLKFNYDGASKEEVEKYYNENKDDFIIPEEKIVSYIDIDLNNYNNEEAKNKLSKLEDLILSSKNIDEISNEFNIDKNFITYSKNSKNLPQDLNFEILQYSQGTFSDLIYKDNNIYRVYYIEKIIPSKMLTLNEVESEIKKILFEKEKRKNDEVLIEKLIVQIRNNNIDKVATRNGFKLEKNKKIYQNDFDYSDEFVNSVYSIKDIGKFSKPLFIPEDNIYIFARLNHIDELTPDTYRFVSSDVIKNRMNRTYKNSILKLFGKYLIQSNKIIINQKILNSLQ